MNDTPWQCSHYPSVAEFEVYIPFSVISLISCLVTLILVCVLKLHKTLVYRLALYQVLSAMEFSILWIAVLSQILNGSDYSLIVINALLLGSMVMKLMFTVWIVVHLFALAVFHKKLQRLEPLYVASSLLIPLMVTAVILYIGLAGITSKYACMFEDIMYIIVFGVLVLTSWLIFTMGTVLCYRACRRRNLVLSEYDKQHKKALCEMLPLLLYPIMFLLLTTPIFAYSVLDITTPEVYVPSDFIFSICAPIWSFTTSMFFMCHLCVVRHIRKRRLLKIRNALRYNRGQLLREEGSVTVNETTRLCQRSDTHYTAPTED